MGTVNHIGMGSGLCIPFLVLFWVYRAGVMAYYKPHVAGSNYDLLARLAIHLQNRNHKFVVQTFSCFPLH